MERNYRIVAICNPYHARFHYRGQEVLRYDVATPVEWVMEDDLTEAEAHEILDSYACDLSDDVSYYDDDYHYETIEYLTEEEGMSLIEACQALVWYVGEGYYLDHSLYYKCGDDSLRDDVMLYRIEEKY